VLVLCAVAGIVALLPLFLVIFYLLVEGSKAWSPAFLVSPRFERRVATSDPIKLRNARASRSGRCES